MNTEVSGKVIHALIIDDEPIACDLLDWMLKQDPEIHILGTCKDGKAALTAIREKHPDLIFLDIQMPDLDGFALLQKLRAEERPYLIFVTAFDSYAVRAFDVHAIDYLLKPFNQRRFQKALRRAKEHIFGQKQLALLQNDLSKTAVENHSIQRLEIKVSGRILFIPVSEISWIEAADQYADVHREANSYLVRVSMSWLEKNLNPADFVRIHRSVIVNVNFVREAVLNKERGRYLTLKDGKKLRISRRRVPALRKSSLSAASIH
ncbi:LytTR family DNA-binding domain-containing protein [bacterium]|nr:LytTR family DNA-binding domain-containing protein [bacterium]MCI0605140.1 LytTR family DNA-binding domain-containing protein [bacterium]